MDKGILQQTIVFMAVFLLLLVGLDWMQGRPITPGSLTVSAVSALVAAAVYGFILHLRDKKNKRGD